MIKTIKFILGGALLVAHLHGYGQEQSKLLDSLMFNGAKTGATLAMKGLCQVGCYTR